MAKHRTGLDVSDESWTWDDLARELTGRFNKIDLSELIYCIEKRKHGTMKEAGYKKEPIR